MAYTFVGPLLVVVDENMCACCAQQVLSVFDVLHHFGEKTKINLDFGRFCIIFVFGFKGVFVWCAGIGWLTGPGRHVVCRQMLFCTEPQRLL